MTLFITLAKKIAKDAHYYASIYKKAKMPIVFETYIARCLLWCLISFLVSFFVLISLIAANKLPIYFFVYSFVILFIVFFLFYFYPVYKMERIQANIENSMPYAIIFMKGISSAGISPDKIFDFLAESPEFKGMSDEAKYTTKLTKTHGYDVLSALRKTAQVTPSHKLRKFINSYIANLKAGGNFKRFLEIEAREMIIEYRLLLREYTNKLTLYSTMYTALIIAAPLLFIVMTILTNLFGGSVETIKLLELAVLIGLPLANIAYILFIHITQPSV
ncbi:MAG: type II secretion system F family protein [Candidatus Woesearchaeota archaeon]